MKPVDVIHVAIVSNAMDAMARVRKELSSSWVREKGTTSIIPFARVVQYVMSNVHVMRLTWLLSRFQNETNSVTYNNEGP